MKIAQAALTIDSEDFDKGIHLELALSYAWCEGNAASAHEPASASHPEDVRVARVEVVVDGARCVVLFSRDHDKLLTKFNERLQADRAFYDRAVEACFQREADDRETAIADKLDAIENMRNG